MFSAASSAGFEFFGMWLRMWSFMRFPIRLLIAPRALCSAACHIGTDKLASRSDHRASHRSWAGDGLTGGYRFLSRV